MPLTIQEMLPAARALLAAALPRAFAGKAGVRTVAPGFSRGAFECITIESPLQRAAEKASSRAPAMAILSPAEAGSQFRGTRSPD